MKLLISVVLSCAAPFAASVAAEADGSRLYTNHCSACHGTRGEGDGPIAPLLTVNVPNLRELQRKNDGVFPAPTVLAHIDGRNAMSAHGGRQMPVWGDVFMAATREDEPVVAARIAVLVSFIAELQNP